MKYSTPVNVTYEKIVFILRAKHGGVKEFQSSRSNSNVPCKLRIHVLSISIKINQFIS